ncbi:Putative aliphatic sulfonates transport permease protein SsuC [Pigmentiphaga humi]|uniref:Aliphatic sulfonates transport permease protein SsuC n=1 Tax=Pigmentiphaga humi TaxID=2478468 RepID=A0A3P4AYP3_9BURK|nr:ABC transporter permease [Pigmentiphaga humi]VCU68486.1 Putative aliphatic sulfonates transport permease protein SsuC [Pigmentiphaga humi]
MSAVRPHLKPVDTTGGVETCRLVIRRGGTGARRQWTARAQHLLRVVSPFLLLALWEILSQAGGLDRRFFPPPSEIAGSAAQLVHNGTLGEAIAASMRRLALGYAIGAAFGVVVGLALGISRWFRALVEPWLLITYPVPKLAVYPLLVLLVGLGEAPIIILLAITVFYIVAINALAGVLSIKPVILDVGRDCNASFLQSVRTIALPASMPHIMTGLEVSLGLACVVLVAAEFVGAKSGLGYMIWSSWQLFDVSPMYVAITTVSVLGYLCVLGLRLIGRLLMPWHKGQR